MTKHTNPEPAWVGMDVDAQLARYAEEDGRGKALAPGASDPSGPPRRRGLRSALPNLGRGSVPRFRLTA